MIAKARGDNANASRFNWNAANMKMADETATNSVTKRGVRLPAGSARVRVRGLAASIAASARRLKAMAAERAEIMATTIQSSCAADGNPRAASVAPVSANGSANTECSHLIISNVAPRLRKMAIIPIVRQANFLACNPAPQSVARSGRLRCGASPPCHLLCAPVAAPVLPAARLELPGDRLRRAAAIKPQEYSALRLRP